MAAPPRVANHPITPALAAVRDLLNRLPPEFTQQQRDVLERTRATVDLLAERLADPAAMVVSDAALSNGQSWLQVINNELQGALSQNNPSALVASGQLIANVDAISQNLGQFPASQPTDAMNILLEEAQRRLNTMQAAQIQQEELWRSIKDAQARMFEEVSEAKEQGLRRLQEQEVAAGKLLAALGAEATSNGYRLTAEHERKQADFWRWITFAGGIGTALLAGLVLISLKGQEAAAAVRFAVTLPLILLTVYAGRQSAGHRHQEREAKRLELAFGSVDAYLADLGADRRSELKGGLSSNLFRTGAVDVAPGQEYPSSSELVSLLREAIKKLR